MEGPRIFKKAGLQFVDDDRTARIQSDLAIASYLIAKGHTLRARDLAIKAGEVAEKAGLVVPLLDAGGIAERLGDMVAAGRFLSAAGRLQKPSPYAEWDGRALPDGTLLVEQRIRHIGAPIRLAYLLPMAAKLVKRCIVQSDHRLQSLFQRSFPDVEVRVDAPPEQPDVVASYETLMRHLEPDPITRVMLRPDMDLVRQLRERYRAGSGPLIGICWASTNNRKDLPSLTEWALSLAGVEATFVSLQYGDVGADVATLAGGGLQIVDDSSIDSLLDLDSFAAQVLAMDAVLTISNTGAHMAGALGVPTVVMLDDKSHLVWPVESDRPLPWYPTVRLVRRFGRAWTAVFVEALRTLAPAITGTR